MEPSSAGGGALARLCLPCSRGYWAAQLPFLEIEKVINNFWVSLQGYTANEGHRYLVIVSTEVLITPCA